MPAFGVDTVGRAGRQVSRKIKKHAECNNCNTSQRNTRLARIAVAGEMKQNDQNPAEQSHHGKGFAPAGKINCGNQEDDDRRKKRDTCHSRPHGCQHQAQADGSAQMPAGDVRRAQDASVHGDNACFAIEHQDVGGIADLLEQLRVEPQPGEIDTHRHRQGKADVGEHQPRPIPAAALPGAAIPPADPDCRDWAQIGDQTDTRQRQGAEIDHRQDRLKKHQTAKHDQRPDDLRMMPVEAHGARVAAKALEPGAPDKQHYHADSGGEGDRLPRHEFAQRILQEAGREYHEQAGAPITVQQSEQAYQQRRRDENK